MWGMAGWTGSDDSESTASLDRADRARLQLLRHGVGVRRRPQRAAARRDAEAASAASRLYVATKIPPKNRTVAGAPGYAARRRVPRRLHPRVHGEEPREHRRGDARPAAVPRLERHVGARTSGWQRAVRELKDEGLVRAFGISVNRWQPANVLRALDTGLIDAVQVVYNVFDQNPEDELFPACQRQEHRGHRARAVRRRQPDRHADRRARRWPEGDFRNIYFTPENLAATLAARRPRCKRGRPGGHDAAGAGAAAHPAASGRQTVIPGMRKLGTSRRTSPPSDGAGPCRRHLWQS